MFSLICAWINVWVTNREAGDLRRHRAHYDFTVMKLRSNMSSKSPRLNDLKKLYLKMCSFKSWPVCLGLSICINATKTECICCLLINVRDFSSNLLLVYCTLRYLQLRIFTWYVQVIYKSTCVFHTKLSTAIFYVYIWGFVGQKQAPWAWMSNYTTQNT